jgi:hypothetical protein
VDGEGLVRRLKIVVVIFGLTFWGVAGQERAEFPFASGVGRLRVRVNGQGPFPFGFDTGASGMGWTIGTRRDGRRRCLRSGC